MPAFAAYVESHRRYNEIRRVIRPYRQLGAQHLRYARRCLDAAQDAADESLALGAADASGFHRVHAQAWRDYLVAARSETYAPQVICGKQDSAPFMPLHRETCFRAGEDFLEDFVSFFRPLDFARKPRLSIQVTHTRTELVVRLHEDGVGLGERRRRWLEYRGEGSDSYVMRIFVDIENRGRQNDMYIVWPVGGGVSCGPKLNLPASMEQQDHGASWDMIVRLPFKTLGRTPRKGETWGFNVTSNPFVARNACYTWASQYDANNPACYGKITFS